MINIQYYGEIAEKTGCSKEGFDLQTDTLVDLLNRFREKYNINLQGVQVAINQELVSADAVKNLSENDEVALLSAFAGG